MPKMIRKRENHKIINQIVAHHFFSAKPKHWRVWLFFMPITFSAFFLGSIGGFAINPPLKSNLVTDAIDGLNELKIFPDTVSGKSTKSSDYPTFPDLVYEFKIAAIDKLSPIGFDYNSYVKKYIDIYTIERRDQVAQILGLSELYFPIFEDLFDKYQLPMELKYLAVVESALNPLAVSKTGAVGLWQFKINTAKMFNLTVNSYIDERRDPVKSTEAACQYLQYLYKIFNDWNLALAAYNTGPGAVRNAIQRSGGETNFWKIYSLLPEAAQNYVPAFIAAAYVMNNASDHKIIPAKAIITYAETDTVMISKPVSLTAVSKHLNVPVETLRFINPIYRRDYVPDQDKLVPIWLPSGKVKVFISKQKKIFDAVADTLNYHDILAQAGSTANKIKFKHKVKAGEYLHKIAILYGCTLDDLLEWNPELNGDLSVGQVITVWLDKKTYRQLKDEKLIDTLSAGN